MKRVMSSSILRVTLFALAAANWAVPKIGTAQSLSKQDRENQQRETINLQMPAPVRFREARDQGLLVSTWLNGHGPYTFAVDTGAGVTVIPERLVLEAGLTVRTGKRTLVGGLSGVGHISNREATIRQFALGDRENRLPSRNIAVVVPSLPPGLDGILDPTEAYYPLGYSIDLPRRSLEAFDPHVSPLRISQQPPGGAVVRWIRKPGTRRPFVRLGDGQLALIDTGSGLGFAVSAEMTSRANKQGSVRDLSGTAIHSRRVAPTVVTIGSLVLRGVPTDILSGTEKGAPTILGRDALYPFRITFDPLQQLIEIAPMSEDSG